MTRFADVTEIQGQMVSAEQLERACHRYHWAARDIVGKDALELACGSGHGLGLLRASARSLVAGDISEELVAIARGVSGAAVDVHQIDAVQTGAADQSYDRVMLFEALYYLPDFRAFFAEAHRILRPEGVLLLTTANKDLFDFTASPYSTTYLGVVELASELEASGFSVELGGFHAVSAVGLRQRLLRPVKAFASRFGLIPKTMSGKEWMKRAFFGKLVEMPNSLEVVPFKFEPPVPLTRSAPDKTFKIIYCRATKL